MTEALNKKQLEMKAMWESLPESARFDLDAALAKYATPTPEERKVARVAKKTVVEEKKAAIAREARVVIQHLERRAELVERPCKECKRNFASDYLFVTYCGDDCMSKWLLREYGFQWNPEKTEHDRWGEYNEPPAIIKPDNLEKLKDWARRILDLPGPEKFGHRPPEDKLSLTETGNEIRPVAEPGIVAHPIGRVRETEEIHQRPASERGDNVRSGAGPITAATPVQKILGNSPQFVIRDEISTPPRKNRFSGL